MVEHRQERVWMCGVCDRAPASVTPSLVAMNESPSWASSTSTAQPSNQTHYFTTLSPLSLSDHDHREEEYFQDDSGAADHMNCIRREAAAKYSNIWLVPNPDINSKLSGTADLDVDTYLDLNYSSSMEYLRFQKQSRCEGAGGIVPVQKKPHHHLIPLLNSSSDQSCSDCYGYKKQLPSASYSYMVSSSSPEVGVVVPDAAMEKEKRRSDNDTTSVKAMQQGCDHLDREARVSRYREKRKNRKFEKTIRYASRKAYAEKRPRIKGRFVKRTEMNDNQAKSPNQRIYSEAPDDHCNWMADSTAFGIVPSFNLI